MSKPIVPRGANMTSAIVKAHATLREPRRKAKFDPNWPEPKRVRVAAKRKPITLPKLRFLGSSDAE